MTSKTILGFATLCMLVPFHTRAQSAQNIAALQGLATITALPDTQEGKVALDANLRLTSNIQTGVLKQPLLLSFSDQQQLAIQDSFIADGNVTDLADGLGTKLGNAYQAKAYYQSAGTFTNVSSAVADLIDYTNNTTRSDAISGKYFFGNATTDSKTSVSKAAAAILSAFNGTTDVYGKTYQRVAGSSGADPYGNARPFQTEPSVLAFRGNDFFGKPSHSLDWLRGPNQNLIDSPSYPSGHATFGYAGSLLLAILVPERYQQMIARAAEYGNDRIIMGAHYTMDVLAGRALTLHAIAHLLANDPDYVGQTRGHSTVVNELNHGGGKSVVITDYPAALKAARKDLTDFLAASCGNTIATCAAIDNSRFKNAVANEALVDSTQTYDLPTVYQKTASAVEDVGKNAPAAGYLLTSAFPSLTLTEADSILTETEGPGGGFLDNGSEFGIYSRINLYAAAGKAATLEAAKHATARSAQ